MSANALTADQCRIGRAAIGLSEQDLAQAAGVPREAIVALETGTEISVETSHKVSAALNAAGITFFLAPDGTCRMRARTLDGIIEAPVNLSQRRP